MTPSAAGTLSPTPSETGPLIVYFGAINQTGCSYCSSSECICSGMPTPVPVFDAQGRRRFQFPRDVPFLIVVEARPGASGGAVGTTLLPSNPATPPHLQLLVNSPLGNGNAAVDCRSSGSPRDWGGIPAIASLSFDNSQVVIDAMTDLACRFGVFDSAGPCTLNQFGDFGLLGPNPNDTQVKQFCHRLLKSDLFPIGDTILAVRSLDTAGHAGPIVEIVVRITP